MKKTIFKSLSVLAVTVLSAGCIQEAFPEGALQTQTQVSQSETGIQALLSAVPVQMIQAGTAAHYSRYQDQLDFGIASIGLRLDHMLEDIAILGEQPGYDWAFGYSLVNNFSAKNVLPSYFWDCYYPWIKTANDVIVSVDPAHASSDALNMLGQALTYRASFYLDLTRIYSAVDNKYTDVSKVKGLTVPIVTEKTTEEQSKNNPRATQEDMFKFIITDLQNAETYLKGTANPYSLPSLGAVYGLMARAYLEKGYWGAGDADAFKKAKDYAELAISTSGKTPLTEAEWADPVNGFNNGAANNSWIWGIPVSVNNYGNLIAWPAHMAMEAQYGYGHLSFLGINKATYDNIADGDFRRQSWLDPAWTGFGGDYKFNYKFSGSTADAAKFLETAMPYESIKFRPGKGNCTVWQDGNSSDIILMRVEEMHFIMMEALAHSDLPAAVTMLNDFMNNYRMSGGTYTCNTIVSDLESFLDEMLFQKRIEFWGEGITFYDYKRLGEGITRGYPGTNHAAICRYNSDGPSPLWNMVITRLEYQANTGITDETNNPDPSGKLILWNN